MRIVIAGAGKLGFSIAQLLAEDQFDVVVVEIDPSARTSSKILWTYWRLKVTPAALQPFLILISVPLMC